MVLFPTVSQQAAETSCSNEPMYLDQIFDEELQPTSEEEMYWENPVPVKRIENITRHDVRSTCQADNVELSDMRNFLLEVSRMKDEIIGNITTNFNENFEASKRSNKQEIAKLMESNKKEITHLVETNKQEIAKLMESHRHKTELLEAEILSLKRDLEQYKKENEALREEMTRKMQICDTEKRELQKELQEKDLLNEMLEGLNHDVGKYKEENENLRSQLKTLETCETENAQYKAELERLEENDVELQAEIAKLKESHRSKTELLQAEILSMQQNQARCLQESEAYKDEMTRNMDTYDTEKKDLFHQLLKMTQERDLHKTQNNALKSKLSINQALQAENECLKAEINAFKVEQLRYKTDDYNQRVDALKKRTTNRRSRSAYSHDADLRPTNTTVPMTDVRNRSVNRKKIAVSTDQNPMIAHTMPKSDSTIKIVSKGASNDRLERTNPIQRNLDESEKQQIKTAAEEIESHLKNNPNIVAKKIENQADSGKLDNLNAKLKENLEQNSEFKGFALKLSPKDPEDMRKLHSLKETMKNCNATDVPTKQGKKRKINKKKVWKVVKKVLIGILYVGGIIILIAVGIAVVAVIASLGLVALPFLICR